MTTDPIRILLIDDDEDDALITRELLEDATKASGQRYEFTWKASFDQGLEAVLHEQHDLVLVDYQLQPGSGPDLIARARERGCATPFILLTGLSDGTADHKAMAAGASDFLTKGRTDAALLERSIRYGLRHATILAELTSQARELERSNLELEQFARAISHDLRQPLHVIAGYAELLAIRYQGALDDKAREMMGKIVTGVERMNDMIEDLLALARIDAAGERIEDVDCTAIWTRTVADLQPRIRSSGAVVEVPALPVVRGRTAHLEQLFRNLLGNALKFVDEQPPRIGIRCTEGADHWHFVVTDNGIGVPEDQRIAIFEPFERGHSDGRYEGTGVGLALCAKIVQQHGGTIWVEPAEGGGSAFHFRIARSPRS
jgi:two-component system sensor histidine kinase/response regulator